MKKIMYITIGEAGLKKTHSIHTFYDCKYISKENKIKVIYPLSPINYRDREEDKKLYKNSNLELKLIPKTFFSSVLTLLNFPGKYFFYIVDRLFFSFLTLFYLLGSGTDIVFVRDPVIAFFFSISKKIHGKKVVYETHSLWHIRLKNASSIVRMFLRGMDNVALKKSDAVMVFTKWMYNYANKFNRKILVFPAGFDNNIFKPIDKNYSRKKLGIPKEQKILMYSGINFREGLEDLIYSMKNFVKDDKIKLYLVGGLPRQIKDYKRITKGLQLENNIIFAGNVPHERIPYYLNASDLLVSSYSRNKNTEYFASPLKIFEYMAVRKPIVATNIGCLKGILEDGKNAILVEPENSKAMAEGIKKIFKNRKLAEKIAKNAYNDSRKYTHKKRAEEIKKLFEKLG